MHHYKSYQGIRDEGGNQVTYGGKSFRSRLDNVFNKLHFQDRTLHRDSGNVNTKTAIHVETVRFENNSTPWNILMAVLWVLKHLLAAVLYLLKSLMNITLWLILPKTYSSEDTGNGILMKKESEKFKVGNITEKFHYQVREHYHNKGMTQTKTTIRV